MAKTSTSDKTKKSLISRTAAIVILAILVLGFSGWTWWHNVRSNPQRVFNAMVANNLKITGVADHTVQQSGQQELNQLTQLNTSPTNTAQGITTLSQTGDNTSKVVTESIGTPFEDYIRYIEITTSQKGANGKELDFSKVQNIWGKSNNSVATGNVQTNGQLFNQSTLGVIPFVNLPASSRKALVSQINSTGVYNVDYGKVKREIVNGRPRYTYDVSVKPEAYVAMLKQIAHDIGLTQLETVDPSAYANSQPLQFQVSVDVWSRQLVGIAYPGADRAEDLSGHGIINKKVELPKDTISIDELQNRVQSIQ